MKTITPVDVIGRVERVFGNRCGYVCLHVSGAPAHVSVNGAVGNLQGGQPARKVSLPVLR
ncbi:hypothetical protein [Streptomyces sp. NPDC003077]|uniref:hypothetical protein n=1 Tax=Streptomyces sp. NPDC003077 TaxID=3154443 RepID=UPI0033BDA7CC